MSTDLLSSFSAGKKRDISEVLVDSMVRVDINSDSRLHNQNSSKTSSSNERLAYYRPGILASPVDSRNPSPKKTKLGHEGSPAVARSPAPQAKNPGPAVGAPLNCMVSEMATARAGKSLGDWTMVSVSENEFKMVPNPTTTNPAEGAPKPTTEPPSVLVPPSSVATATPVVGPPPPSTPKTVRFLEEEPRSSDTEPSQPPAVTKTTGPILDQASVTCSVASSEEHLLEEEEPSRRRKPAFWRFLPNVGVRRCAGCSSSEEAIRATVWCVECARCLCDDCDARCHETTAVDHLQRPLCSHRVEEISNGGGLPILSPLLELAVLFASLWAAKSFWERTGSNMLTVDYFFESVCPIVQQVRRMVFRVDHALYPVIKGPLGGWCDTEDAFLKVFSDLWVRGVLTHTDSFALLLMKMPSTIGALLVYVAVLPSLLAIPYAIVATIVRKAETALFPNWLVFRLVARLVRLASWTIWLPLKLASWVCRSTTVGLIVDRDCFREDRLRRSKIPPSTAARRRPFPSDGFANAQLFGATSRITRVFWYFHTKARKAIVSTLVTLVFWAVSLRLALLSIPKCGEGFLSDQSSEKECFSVDAWARRWSQRLGVPIPDAAALGEEGRVLARMQEATENDYLDTTLQRLCQTFVDKIRSLPAEAKVLLGGIFALFFFAGLTRRILFWIDLRRRHRYGRRIQAATKKNLR